MWCSYVYSILKYFFSLSLSLLPPLSVTAAAPDTTELPAGAEIPRLAGGTNGIPAVTTSGGDALLVKWLVNADPCPSAVWMKDGTVLDDLEGKVQVSEPNLLYYSVSAGLISFCEIRSSVTITLAHYCIPVCMCPQIYILV